MLTEELLEPLVTVLTANIGVLLPVVVGIFGTFIGIELIPIIVGKFIGTETIQDAYEAQYKDSDGNLLDGYEYSDGYLWGPGIVGHGDWDEPITEEDLSSEGRYSWWFHGDED